MRRKLLISLEIFFSEKNLFFRLTTAQTGIIYSEKATEGFGMYALQVLNGNGEWELIVYLFESRAAAVDFYNENLDMFDDYTVTEMKKY